MPSTELLYLTDAYLRSFTAHVVEVDGDRVALDRTAFYQPHQPGLDDPRVPRVVKEFNG